MLSTFVTQSLLLALLEQYAQEESAWLLLLEFSMCSCRKLVNFSEKCVAGPQSGSGEAAN